VEYLVSLSNAKSLVNDSINQQASAIDPSSLAEVGVDCTLSLPILDRNQPSSR